MPTLEELIKKRQLKTQNAQATTETTVKAQETTTPTTAQVSQPTQATPTVQPTQNVSVSQPSATTATTVNVTAQVTTPQPTTQATAQVATAAPVQNATVQQTVQVPTQTQTTQTTQQEVKTMVNQTGSEDRNTNTTYEDEQKTYTETANPQKFIGTVESKYYKPVLDNRDIYIAELIKLDTKLCNTQKGKEEKYLWNFVIYDMDGKLIVQDKNGRVFDKGVSLSLFTTLNYGPKSKNFDLYQKLTGETLNLGDQYDLQKCVGKKMRIFVKNVKAKQTGEEFSVIDNFVPMK